MISLTGLGTLSDQDPEFLQPLDNLTVTQGRDVSFTCVVNNLGQYKVSTGNFKLFLLYGTYYKLFLMLLIFVTVII